MCYIDVRFGSEAVAQHSITPMAGIERKADIRLAQLLAMLSAYSNLADRVGLARSLCELPANWQLRRSNRVRKPIPHSAKKTKRPHKGAFLFFWRRGWDSNPRRATNPCWFSRPVHSTTLPPLRCRVSRRELCLHHGPVSIANRTRSLHVGLSD